MNSNPEADLELIEEMSRKGARKGSKSVLLPRWAGLSISVLAGLSFTAVVEFGVIGILIIPVVFFIFLLHYLKSDVWPHFWPTRNTINLIGHDLHITPAYILYVVFAICGGISVPFLLIQAIEFKNAGIVWASYAGGGLVMIFAATVFELEQYFAKNK